MFMLGRYAVMHQLSFGSYEENKNVYFVFICDLIKKRDQITFDECFFRFSLAM